MSRVSESILQYTGMKGVSSSVKGPKTFCTENGIHVIYEVLCVIQVEKQKSQGDQGQKSFEDLLDCVFVMLCLPDVDSSKIQNVSFQPII
jgi:hypothetical protein